jgi:hypothetical protein
MKVNPAQLYECFRGIGIFYLIVIAMFFGTMFFQMWKDMNKISKKLGDKATKWLTEEE